MFAMTSLVGTPVVAAPTRATRTVRNTKTMAAGKPNAGKKVRDDARTMCTTRARSVFFRASLAPSAPPRTPRARRIAPPDEGTRTSASVRDRRARDRRGGDRVARASTRARRAGVSDKIPRATNEATCQRRQSHTVRPDGLVALPPLGAPLVLFFPGWSKTTNDEKQTNR